MEESADLAELNRRLDRKVQQLEALIDFGRALAGAVDPEEVERRLDLTLAGQWALRTHAVVALRDGRMPLLRHRGMAPLERLGELLGRGGSSALAGWNRPMRLTEMTREGSSSAILDLLNEARAAAVVPLVSGETTIGFAALGARPASLPWDDDELAHAFGIAGQAVVAFEGAWQSEEAARWRLVSEVGAEWRALDRLSRLVFIGIARLGFEKPLAQTEAVPALSSLLAQAGLSVGPDRIATTIERLIGKRALARDSEGLLRIEKQPWLSLPEARKPLAEIARETTERVGAYELLDRLGGGGMGEVFRAVNVHDGSSAAVKLLYAGAADDEEARRRLEREGAIVASLSHPNIVRLLERGEHEGRLYLAMELVEGESLSVFLHSKSLLPNEVLAAAADLASALSALHSRGAVHRDLKSSNIMRTTDGRLVLLDFGLARGPGHSTVTRQGDVLGTLPYMAPEQLRGERADAQADVWSFGIVLFEMLTGRLPWKGNDTVSLAIEILMKDPEIASQLEGIAAPPLVALVSDALVPDREKRIADGSELARRLAQIDLSGITGIPAPGTDRAAAPVTRPNRGRPGGEKGKEAGSEIVTAVVSNPETRPFDPKTRPPEGA